MARPGSRVRPLEASSNRRPREMIVAPLTRGTEPGLQAFSGALLYVFFRRFEQLHDPPPARDADVACNLRGRHRLVTQQIANVPDVGPALEELGRVAVPESSMGQQTQNRPLPRAGLAGDRLSDTRRRWTVAGSPPARPSRTDTAARWRATASRRRPGSSSPIATARVGGVSLPGRLEDRSLQDR